MDMGTITRLKSKEMPKYGDFKLLSREQEVLKEWQEQWILG